MIIKAFMLRYKRYLKTLKSSFIHSRQSDPALTISTKLANNRQLSNDESDALAIRSSCRKEHVSRHVYIPLAHGLI